MKSPRPNEICTHSAYIRHLFYTFLSYSHPFRTYLILSVFLNLKKDCEVSFYNLVSYSTDSQNRTDFFENDDLPEYR